MDSDPAYWTITQVAHFFRHDASRFARAIPNLALPEMVSFTQALEVNDVSGYILLNDVDDAFLKDDCGIKSLGKRKAVLSCISALRAHSELHRRRDDAMSIDAPALHVSASPPPPPPPFTAVPNLDLGHGPEPQEIGEKRSAEMVVQDAKGRKRRKLVLRQADQPQAAQSVIALEDLISTYLPKAAWPVDELFFGDTAMGKEIKELRALREISTLEQDKDEPDNFQFCGLPSTDGEVAFVSSRMRHFFGAEIQNLRRNGRPAHAIIPYRETLLLDRKAQSMVVFKMIEDDSRNEPIAVRERVAYLDTDVEYPSLDDSSSGEWDFLLTKHRQPNREDVVLPTLDKSEDGDSITSSLMKEIEEERADVEAARSKVLSSTRISEVVEEMITKYVNDWLEKLPQREEREAWSIWKQMKRSKRVQNALIGSARARISAFQKRISGFKDRFLTDEWSSESSLRNTCEAMKVTVEDMEKDTWRISVWERKQEPEHIVKHTTNLITHKHPSTTGANGITVPVEDRMSVSPTKHDVSQEPATAAGQEEDNRLHTPSTGQIVYDEGSVDGFEAADEMSLGPEGADDFIASSPPIQDKADDPKKDPDYMEEDSDELPDPSTFVASATRVKQESPTFSAPRPGQSSHSHPIDLTLSSDSQTPSKRKSKPKPPVEMTYSANPLEDGPTQVKSWAFEDLLSNHDRTRILIKILFEQGLQFRERLHKTRRDMTQSDLALGIGNALVGLEALSRAGTVLDLGQEDAVTAYARLMLIWLLVPADARDPSSIDWVLVRVNATQSTRLGFLMNLDKVLQKRHSKVFASPPKPSASSSAPVTISSGEERLTLHRTPHKKRKKTVKRSANAEQSQARAHNRQQLHLESSYAGVHADVTDSGKILINPVKTDEREFIYIPKKLAESMKQHQVEGVRFMWREITADGEDGQGCILAHVMGLGKTMQTIALLVSINRAARSEDPLIHDQLPIHLREIELEDDRQLRMLVLCPPQLIQNWCREIAYWAPKRLEPIYAVESGNKLSMMDQLVSWHKFGGVLIMGYELFRSRLKKEASDRVKGGGPQNHLSELEKILLEGPEIVIADEAQKLKNVTSAINLAVNKIHTPSKICLSGTPMSNDVDEIFALVSLVAPGYLGSRTEFQARFTEPIREGQYMESTRYEVRKGLMKLAVLSRKIDPKVHRKDITALRGSLKSKVEFLITLPISTAQRETYKKFVAALLGDSRNEGASQVAIFSWLSVLTLLLNHPVAFKRKLLAPPAKSRLKSGPTPSGPTQPGPDSGPNTPLRIGDDDEGFGVDLDEVIRTLGLPDQTIKDLVTDIHDDIAAHLSHKMNILLQILEAAKQLGDRTLVFSSSIPNLDYMAELLTSQKISFGRIDGGVQISKRNGIIEDLDAGKTDVMLLSTRAAGVGLNIQSANRVVIIDFGFNPTHEEQAIGRAYRLGQTKPVFVYRLRCGGTFETNIYNKQMFKTSLSSRVVDKKNPRRTVEREARQWLYEPRGVEQKDLLQWVGKDEVMDRMIQSQLGTTIDDEPGLIRELSTMEILQQDANDEPLDEQERKTVQEEIDMDLMMQGKGKRASFVPPPPASSMLPPPATATPAAHPPMPAYGYSSVATPAATQPSPARPSPINTGGLPVASQWFPPPRPRG